MNNKKIYLLSVGLLIIISFIFYICLNVNDDYSSDIPSGYSAVYIGESGEIKHSTYIYKLNSKKKKYKYINTVTKLSNIDSASVNEEVLKKKKVKKKKSLFKAAKKNYANKYVLDIENNKIYSINEFEKVFK